MEAASNSAEEKLRRVFELEARNSELCRAVAAMEGSAFVRLARLVCELRERIGRRRVSDEVATARTRTWKAEPRA